MMTTRDTTADISTSNIVDAVADFWSEEAAYQRERKRLVQTHPGHFALIHVDEVVDVFPTFREAVLERGRQFGLAKTMVREIIDPEEPAYMPHVDIDHPSFRRFN